MLSTTKGKNTSLIPKEISNSGKLLQPSLVDNSRVDSLLKKIDIESKIETVSDLNQEWTLFIDDLNTKMFDKISF